LVLLPGGEDASIGLTCLLEQSQLVTCKYLPDVKTMSYKNELKTVFEELKRSNPNGYTYCVITCCRKFTDPAALAIAKTSGIQFICIDSPEHKSLKDAKNVKHIATKNPATSLPNPASCVITIIEQLFKSEPTYGLFSVVCNNHMRFIQLVNLSFSNIHADATVISFFLGIRYNYSEALRQGSDTSMHERFYNYLNARVSFEDVFKAGQLIVSSHIGAILPALKTSSLVKQREGGKIVFISHTTPMHNEFYMNMIKDIMAIMVFGTRENKYQPNTVVNKYVIIDQSKNQRNMFDVFCDSSIYNLLPQDAKPSLHKHGEFYYAYCLDQNSYLEYFS